jgi:PBP1b-binding outer membrane lipoprotein LpoB
MKRFIAILLLALTVSACVSPAPYHPVAQRIRVSLQDQFPHLICIKRGLGGNFLDCGMV